MQARGRQGQEAGLSVADEGVWLPPPEDEECVVEVVMSAERLEEGLGLPAGQLPQSFVKGESLVLTVVGKITFPVFRQFFLRVHGWSRQLHLKML